MRSEHPRNYGWWFGIEKTKENKEENKMKIVKEGKYKGFEKLEESTNCYHKWDFFGQFCNACGEFSNHGELISKCLVCGAYWGNEYKSFLHKDEIENLKDVSNWNEQEIKYKNRKSQVKGEENGCSIV